VNEAEFRDLISGNRRGIPAALVRGALTGLSLPYRCITLLRNAVFDVGLRQAQRAAVPVVSVGNLTAGGTGKTPLVAYLANWFRDRGVRTVLLSRGYRALPGEVNDEKLVLDRTCPGVPHLQHPDRVQLAAIACHDYAAQLLILDDGFQHRRLHRELDIVLIDALNPWGYGRLLPRGLLREPVSALRRADLIVLTRADQCPASQKQEIIDRIASLGRADKLVEVAFPAQGLVNVAGETCALAALQRRPVAAFCGIGNPDGFRRTLASVGFEPASFDVFPDHHHYTPADLDRLGNQAAAAGASAVLTTLKDLVKCDRRELQGVPLWAVTIGVEIQAGAERLHDQLERIANSIT
jgi:tetraacyldisaccharide 4'-kinase